MDSGTLVQTCFVKDAHVFERLFPDLLCLLQNLQFTVEHDQIIVGGCHVGGQLSLHSLFIVLLYLLIGFRLTFLTCHLSEDVRLPGCRERYGV